MAEILVVMALELESQGLFEAARIPVLFTGIGKVNAAYALTRKLAEYRQDRKRMPHVVNFGTAGSSTLMTGTVVACQSFIQLDMDVTALGFARGVTPFESTPTIIEYPRSVPLLQSGSCGSADSFVAGGQVFPCDVRDMEAFALAKVCWLEMAPFTCVKYITDGADHTATKDWEANLPKAASEFIRIYKEQSGGIRQ